MPFYCKGAMACLESPKSFSVGAHDPWAHWRSRYWAALQEGTIVPGKTAAHATSSAPEAGRSTWWGARASDAADSCAQLGADARGLNERAAGSRQDAGQLAQGAPSWSAEQEVYLAKHQVQDSPPLQDQPSGPTGLLGSVQDRQRAPALGNPARHSDWPEPWEHDTEGSGREGPCHPGHRIKMAPTSHGGRLPGWPRAAGRRSPQHGRGRPLWGLDARTRAGRSLTQRSGWPYWAQPDQCLVWNSEGVPVDSEGEERSPAFPPY